MQLPLAWHVWPELAAGQLLSSQQLLLGMHFCWAEQKTLPAGQAAHVPPAAGQTLPVQSAVEQQVLLGMHLLFTPQKVWPADWVNRGGRARGW